MPRLRRQSGPIVKCGYEFCAVNFRQWGKRLYCSDNCRKQAWRCAHRPYYRELRREERHRETVDRRRQRRFKWVEADKVEEVPEIITLTEAVGQATPAEKAQIMEILHLD